MSILRDDLGAEVRLPHPPRRICSLVPSLSEAISVSAGERLVAATDWCTHLGPHAERVTRVRGTKNPDLRRIIELAPDIVIANQEENRELDVRRLRAAGVPVWVTRIETLNEAFSSLQRIFAELMELDEPSWLAEARDIWRPAPRLDLEIVVPIWKDPWMVVGHPTFTADLLGRTGARVRALAAGRYPHLDVPRIIEAAPDVVLLPDEPYPFGPQDGPEDLPGMRTRCLPGRWITWYGPSLVQARGEIEQALDATG